MQRHTITDLFSCAHLLCKLIEFPFFLLSPVTFSLTSSHRHPTLLLTTWHRSSIWSEQYNEGVQMKLLGDKDSLEEVHSKTCSRARARVHTQWHTQPYQVVALKKIRTHQHKIRVVGVYLAVCAVSGCRDTFLEHCCPPSSCRTPSLTPSRSLARPFPFLLSLPLPPLSPLGRTVLSRGSQEEARLYSGADGIG